MSTNRFWSRGISLACLGVFSLFLMTASTGCSKCCMRTGSGDNQTQAGFNTCGANCTKACCKKATTQTQAGFDTKCSAKCNGSGCKGKSGCSAKARAACTGRAKTLDGATTASGNKNCPISGRPVSAGVTASYGDKTVGFCCGGCIGKWNAMTDADKTSKLAGA